MLAGALVKWAPGTVRELLRQRRLSFWHKTSRSPHEQTIWAYADRHSIEPGQGFRLMMSAGPGVNTVTGRVEIFRIGDYGKADRRRVWRSGCLEVAEHGLTNTAAALGPAWPAALSVEETASWQTGYHSVDFVEPEGRRHRDIAFLVVTAPEPRADVLIKIATATYQAYNKWGGHNLYLYETPGAVSGHPLGVFERDVPANRGDMVSFDRPTPSEFWDWEYYLVLWLERVAREEGFSLAYATNFDLTREPAFTSNCRLLISAGHDEYWSKEEFDRAHDRIFHQGGNTLFLGANTAYWQVRYADVNSPPGNEGQPRGRQLICFKSMADPVCHRAELNPELHATARFRDNARRPETMLTGVGYQSNLPFRYCENLHYPYRVANTAFPFFEGTGYRQGEIAGEIIGHEWDNRDPEAEYACPGEARVEGATRLWREGSSHIEPIPAERIKTVFSGETVDSAGRKGLAEAVYFESDAGAKVFSSGTNRWTWGLCKAPYTNEKFRRLNRNLILHFLRSDG
ncbi:MAG: N,N-dimethylformamidase beta subunit family domain-containing protein [Alphaproteobacteria bacterium]